MLHLNPLLCFKLSEEDLREQRENMLHTVNTFQLPYGCKKEMMDVINRIIDLSQDDNFRVNFEYLDEQLNDNLMCVLRKYKKEIF